MRRLFAIILVCALIVSVGIGCKKAAVTPTDQVVNLGSIFGMTGASSSFGIAEDKGTAMAVEEFNAAGGATIGGVKTTINYINEDDTGLPEVGASAVHKLIDQDKVIGIIGAQTSMVSLAIAPVLQAAGIPMISPSSTNEKVTLVGDYIFRSCFLDAFQGRVMANYVWNTLKLKTAAVLYDNANDYNMGIAQIFKTSF